MIQKRQEKDVDYFIPKGRGEKCGFEGEEGGDCTLDVSFAFTASFQFFYLPLSLLLQKLGRVLLTHSILEEQKVASAS